MPWQIRPIDLEVFRRNLWKDERDFSSISHTSPDIFPKQCFTSARARHEARVIEHLNTFSDEPLCPRIRGYDNSILLMDNIGGIRLFDLIRMLRLYHNTSFDTRAASAMEILLKRCVLRLSTIQRGLLLLAQTEAASPYPLEEKLVQLLSLLSRVLDVHGFYERAVDDITRLSGYWLEHCAQIPFRDATTKNILVQLPELSISTLPDGEDRYRLLCDLVAQSGDAFWQSVPIFDIDFSSTEHLTSVEDDPISLLCHECTAGILPSPVEKLVLVDELHAPDGYRSAATLVVRYLRFGGRKLAYKLLNQEGFNIRFRFDDPVYYFATMRRTASSYSRNFVDEFPRLFDLVELICDSFINASPADRGLMEIDHFRRMFSRKDYWQENPNELRR